MVTTGGRDFNFDSSSPAIMRRQSGTSPVSTFTSSTTSGIASNPYSATTIAAVSKSTDWLMVAITPLDINFLIRSIGLFPTTCARSRITMLAGISILFPLLLIGPPPQITNFIEQSWDVVVCSAQCTDEDQI